MGAFVTADASTRVITVTKVPVSGLSSLNVQIDIFSDLKEDWLASSALQKLEFPFTSFGDPKSATEDIGPYMFLRNDLGWRILPYDADHELTLNGNLVATDTDLPVFNSRAGRTITIRQNESAQALTSSAGVVVASLADDSITAAVIADNAIDAGAIATGALTSSKFAAGAIDATALATDAVEEIADQIWDELQAGHVAAGTFGEIATEIATLLTRISAARAGFLDTLQAQQRSSIEGQAQTGTLTTTQATTDLTGFANGELVGGYIIWDKDAAGCPGFRSRITAFSSASGLITWADTASAAPVNGDNFTIA